MLICSKLEAVRLDSLVTFTRDSTEETSGTVVNGIAEWETNKSMDE